MSAINTEHSHSWLTDIVLQAEEVSDTFMLNLEAVDTVEAEESSISPRTSTQSPQPETPSPPPAAAVHSSLHSPHHPQVSFFFSVHLSKKEKTYTYHTHWRRYPPAASANWQSQREGRGPRLWCDAGKTSSPWPHGSKIINTPAALSETEAGISNWQQSVVWQLLQLWVLGFLYWCVK